MIKENIFSKFYCNVSDNNLTYYHFRIRTIRDIVDSISFGCSNIKMVVMTMHIKLLSPTLQQNLLKKMIFLTAIYSNYFSVWITNTKHFSVSVYSSDFGCSFIRIYFHSKMACRTVKISCVFSLRASAMKFQRELGPLNRIIARDVCLWCKQNRLAVVVAQTSD